MKVGAHMVRERKVGAVVGFELGIGELDWALADIARLRIGLAATPSI